jgi:hypothetical protein
MLEEFNKLPKAAKDMAIDRIRKGMERDPEVAKKLTGELEQARENIRALGYDRSMGR